MSKISVQDMADIINKDCENYDYLPAYRLVKETLNLWKTESFLAMLCDTGKMMVEDALEEQS